MADDVMTYF